MKARPSYPSYLLLLLGISVGFISILISLRDISLLPPLVTPTSLSANIVTVSSTAEIIFMSQTSTSTLIPLPTVTSTRLRLTATPSRTKTPFPTSTSTYTSTPTRDPSLPTSTITPPIILYPIERSSFGSITLRWEWEGELAENLTFAIRFWPAGKPEEVRTIAWTNGNEHTLFIDNGFFSPGDYFFNISLVNTRGSGQWVLITESNAQIQAIPSFLSNITTPTLEPPPLPSITWTPLPPP